MKAKYLQITPLLILAMIFSPAASAVSFIQYVDSDGKLSTSNLPESCVVDGILVCYEYYSVLNSGPIPVYRKPSPTKTIPLKSAAQPSSSSKSSIPEVASEETPVVKSPTVIPDTNIICNAGDDQGLEKAKDFYPFLTDDDCAEMGTSQPQINLPQY